MRDPLITVARPRTVRGDAARHPRRTGWGSRYWRRGEQRPRCGGALSAAHQQRASARKPNTYISLVLRAKRVRKGAFGPTASHAPAIRHRAPPDSWLHADRAAAIKYSGSQRAGPSLRRLIQSKVRLPPGTPRRGRAVRGRRNSRPRAPASTPWVNASRVDWMSRRRLGPALWLPLYLIAAARSAWSQGPGRAVADGGRVASVGPNAPFRTRFGPRSTTIYTCWASAQNARC